jgi:hypothetical protein
MREIRLRNNEEFAMAPTSIPLILTNDTPIGRTGWPVTRGVPLPAGLAGDIDACGILAPDGQPVPAQFRALSRWPDGTVRWVLADFQADVPANGKATYTLRCEEPGALPTHDAPIRTEEDEDGITVCTGPLRFRVSRRRFGLFERVEYKTDGAEFFPVYQGRPQGGEAWVRISEGSLTGGTQRRLYGMGGVCRASLAPDAYTVVVEEAGPLRTVLRLDALCEADIPMHHYAGYRPFRCTTRIHAYAGQALLRVLHTVVMVCNPRETEIEEIGIEVPATLTGAVRRYALAANRPAAGALAPGETLHLAQRLDNHFRLYRHAGTQGRIVAEGERAEGWIALDDGVSGVAVGLRYMAEEYPKALEVSHDGGGIALYLWRDPDGGRLSLKRYAEEVAWHEGEGVYADGTGIAKTSEFFIHFYAADQRDGAVETIRGGLAPPHLAVDPVWMARCEAAGGFQPHDPARFPASERMMTGFVDWLMRCIRLGRWYGFLDWGDALAVWDEAADDWRFRGRWGWCNSEWDPRHGVWIQYLRTGDARYFHLGEAMTRHSTDVDTCHAHPFRPYMAGGCFRHSLDHFSDEPCASHTFIDNWVDYYYLTGDGRTLDVLKEAGAFFLRYRWTEDPAYSFSLRSIGNTLRGLLYLHEVTGDARFSARAEEVYDAIARGQNDDGSWHKRFHVATPDRLPDQAPYGMATEGTTLAVEMGTAPPFTDEEYRALGGSFARLIRVLPYEEQKGYQTHYLMTGLELLHRMTGRADVADVYCRAVDWFCGYPDVFASDRPLREHYGGILCRHLAYAWRLTRDTRYLETGRRILHELIRTQDWSDHPKRRGAVGMSPTYLSLLFFGVPYFLGALEEAGMEE